jgi:hypothetical protein
MGRAISFGIGMLLLTVGAPLFIAHQWQLGSAKSPQTATILLGTRLIVAGGKAQLWFACADESGPTIEVVWNKGRNQFVKLEGEEPVETDSGLTLTQIDTSEAPNGMTRTTIKVEWDDAH